MRFELKEEVQINSVEKVWENGILGEMDGFEIGYCMLVFDDVKAPYVEAKYCDDIISVTEPGYTNRTCTKAILFTPELDYKFNMRIYGNEIHVYSLHWPFPLPLVFRNKGTYTLYFQCKFGKFSIDPGQVCLICGSPSREEITEELKHGLRIEFMWRDWLLPEELPGYLEQSEVYRSLDGENDLWYQTPEHLYELIKTELIEKYRYFNRKNLRLEKK